MSGTLKISYVRTSTKLNKLMWILSTNRKEHKLRQASIVGEREIILVLDDESSHSIMMSDKESAVRLQNTAHMILLEEINPPSIRVHRNTVHLDLV